MAAKKTWVITTSGARSIRAIARDLTAAGLADSHVLKEIGTITGSATEKVVAKLRKVPGVVEVSPDIAVDVGPPDSPETW